MEPGPRMLGDRYELTSLLASGGMGRVWRGRDTLLNRAVAIKVLRSEFTDDAAFVARFRAEAQHAAALHHPNIASVFDYGELEEHGERMAYLVMELVEGESLASLLARERRLDVPTSLQIMRGTAAALAVAHEAGLVHRDVKPGNVLVARDGAVKITDFGIAWSASSVPLTRTGQVIGTAHYLSPEQAQGGKATPASDVYALGAVTYECLAGRRVFEGENSVQIAVKQIREEPDPLPRDIPADVRRLVEQAMAKDPTDRIPDGAALLAAVDRVLAGRPPAPVSHSTAPIAAVAPDGPAGPTGTAVMPLPVLPAQTQRPVPTRRTEVREPEPAAKRRPTALIIGALVALALVAAVVIGWTALSGNDPAGTSADGTSSATTSTTATTTTTPPPPPTVDLDPAAYIGHPVGEVQTALAGLGLTVVVQQVETADMDAGLVVDLTPVQGLAPNATVTVSEAVAPPAPAPGNGDDGHGHKKKKKK